MADYDNIQGRNGLADTVRQDLKTNIGDRANLSTTEKGTIVGAINELASGVSTLEGAVADNVQCAADADATAVRTAVIAILTKLKAAGLMEADPAG